VVRRVLSDVAKTGSLPGEHHFYVTFDTRAPGVRLSPRLREQYPEEMTIVLQHQFWDLAVTDAHFEVALSFNGISEKLHVPLDAIKGFFDPSVQFGLQFEEAGETAEETGDEESSAKANDGRTPVPGEQEAAPPAPPVNAPANLDPAKTSAGDSEKPGGGEVVRLDRFRKK
jgi:uncharacterized protein